MSAKEPSESRSGPLKRPLRRWIGGGGVLALALVVTARVLLEPLRDEPQFDRQGMETSAAVETYVLRGDPDPFSLAIFGSSVTIWGVMPEVVAGNLNIPPEKVRKLAVVGGTPFDYWNLVRRNPGRFEDVPLALIEISPRMFKRDLEEDERIRFSISQHATLAERNLLWRRIERRTQRAEWVFPLRSVRRSLRSVFLGFVRPVPGTPVHPAPDARLRPLAAGWHVSNGSPAFFRGVVSPEIAARRWVGHWRCSRLQDHALRQTLGWFRERKIPVILYQIPAHSRMLQHVKGDPDLAGQYAAYEDYVMSLAVPPAHFLQFESIDECSIPPEGMRDWFHLNETGARVFSKVLSDRIISVPGISNAFD
jgi:hypothetical protein